MAPKARIINILIFHFGGSKTSNIDQRRKIFKRIKKRIKHISDRKFQLKMVPLDAERCKLFKYMWFCHRRYCVASPGDHKWAPRQRSRHCRLTMAIIDLSRTIVFLFLIMLNKYIDINIYIVNAYP